MAVTINVGDGLMLKNGNGGDPGVYMIMFDTGYYYIGSSIHLNWRIRTHLASLRSNFTSKPTCKSLQQMRGFEGSVAIVLLECGKGLKRRSELLARENYHINTRSGDEYMLNRTTMIFDITQHKAVCA